MFNYYENKKYDIFYAIVQCSPSAILDLFTHYILMSALTPEIVAE